jgi:hypothetical protein
MGRCCPGRDPFARNSRRKVSEASDRELRRSAFHQFEPIAEGVVDVDAAEIVEAGVGLGGKTSAFARGDDIVEAVASF